VLVTYVPFCQLFLVVFVLISAPTQDYFEHLQLIKSLDDYAAYVDRFPKFLLSENLHSERVAFRRYKASCVYSLCSEGVVEQW